MTAKQYDRFAIAADQHKKEKEYWLAQFSNDLPPRNFPYDDAVEPDPGFDRESLTVAVSPATAVQLEAISKQSPVKLHMILVCGTAALLQKYLRSTEVVLGVPVYQQAAEGEYINNALALRHAIGEDCTFRTLLYQVQKTIIEATEHQNYPLEALIRELGLPVTDGACPLFDVMVCLKGLHEQKCIEATGHNLTFLFEADPGALHLTITFNPKRFRSSTIRRIATHLNVLLEQMVANPHQPISQLTLVSEGERLLIESLSQGKAHSFASRRIEAVFADHARAQPLAPALVLAGRQWSYQQVDEQAQRVAAFLGAQGVSPQQVIGLCVLPDEYLLIGLLGILKAGCAYLPLDPQLPESRLHYMLADSDAQLVLTNLAFPPAAGRPVYQLEALCRPRPTQGETAQGETAQGQGAEGQGADALCYVIYTSGSTGMPKGVMISHANLLNYCHWFAHRFALSASDHSLLSSSFAFDLGYSSLFPVLLAGGTLHLLERQHYAQPAQLLAYLQAQRVSYLKMTPTLFSLWFNSEHYPATDLSALRLLVLGGEPLRAGEVAALLGRYPQLEVVNHYGPTETTVGVISQGLTLAGMADFARRPVLGRPIYNTSAYVLDQHLGLQAIGLVGEICIGGKSVGRGYLNAPELSAGAYLASPLRPGERLYRTGDLGRLHPDGRVEYLGRADQQVKVRGYRVGLQEVEQALLSHPLVSKAVVLSKAGEQGHSLSGYLVAAGPAAAAGGPAAGPAAAGPEAMRAYLLGRLPEYMVPSELQWVEQIPMRANGKVDQQALLAHKAAVLVEEPQGAVEQKLLAVWQQVLSLAAISTSDNFFTIGGDSIKAIQVTARMHKAGYKFELNDIMRYSSIRELAPRVKVKDRIADQSAVEGEVLLTPIQKAFLGNATHCNHYNQSLLLSAATPLRAEGLRLVFARLQQHHDALRMRFVSHEDGWRQSNGGPDHPLSFEVCAFTGADAAAQLDAYAQALQGSMRLDEGPLMKAALIRLSDGDRLLVVIHHLVVDGVSWRILLEDLNSLYSQYLQNQDLVLPLKSDSFKAWAEKLREYSKSEKLLNEKTYWEKELGHDFARLPKDYAVSDNYVADAVQVTGRLSSTQTAQLLTGVHEAYNTTPNDLLLAALALGLQRVFGQTQTVVELEGHGREQIAEALDCSRTIGWFTSRYPVVLRAGYADDLSRQIKETKESMRRIPDKGIGYGILKYLVPGPAMLPGLIPEVSFNYLGQFDADFAGMAFQPAREPAGNNKSGLGRRTYVLDVTSMVTGKELLFSIAYNRNHFREETIRRLSSSYQAAIGEIINHCLSKRESDLTPSDLTYKGLSLDELDSIFN